MARYVAFLRGVSPMNAKMPELLRCFERAGFSEVKTLLSSGNVVFTARTQSAARLERTAEAAMVKHLARKFYTIVRPVEALQKLIAADPFGSFALPAKAKRVVTFLREPREPAQPLPVEQAGARILAMDGREIFTAYIPSPKGPVFMTLIERTFGSDVTTRTWETLTKCAQA